MKNKTIGVFFGGKNPEHDVSIITGQLIISELKKAGYKVVPVYVTKKGEWCIDDKLGYLKFFTNKPSDEDFKETKKYSIDLEESIDKLVFKNKKIFSKKIIIDIAFPAFHGENGEDGTIQGLFDFLNIPYTGCDVSSSAISMDKALTKMFYISQGISTTNFIFFNQAEWDKGKQDLIKRISDDLNWPVFVKPTKLGSSIGMTKVTDKKELENACEVALHYDSKIIVEESVENLKDITCAVLGDENPVASLLQESVFDSDHFSYEDKYLKDGGAQLGNAQDSIVIPARLDEEITKETQELALKIFKLLGCSGIARVDFLYDNQQKKMYANEINSLPGTLYHHLWEKSGIAINEVIEKMLKIALARHTNKEKTTKIFDSEILNQANSIKLQINKKN